MKLSDEVKGELLYDCAAFACIQKKWPKATQENARDCIHSDRIAVSIPGVTYEEFYNHALDNGYSEVSFVFSI